MEPPTLTSPSPTGAPGLTILRTAAVPKTSPAIWCGDRQHDGDGNSIAMASCSARVQDPLSYSGPQAPVDFWREHCQHDADDDSVASTLVGLTPENRTTSSAITRVETKIRKEAAKAEAEHVNSSIDASALATRPARAYTQSFRITRGFFRQGGGFAHCAPANRSRGRGERLTLKFSGRWFSAATGDCHHLPQNLFTRGLGFARA